jgi:hypothetical protein
MHTLPEKRFAVVGGQADANGRCQPIAGPFVDQLLEAEPMGETCSADPPLSTSSAARYGGRAML